MSRTEQSLVNTVFYTCVSKPLLVYRFIGLLPIEGLWYPDSKKSRLTLKSLYTIYLGIVLCSHILGLVLILYCLSHKEKTIVKEISEVIMAITCIMICISIFHLSKNWTQRLRKIESIEMLLPPLRSREIFVRRIKWFVFIMFIVCLGQHFFTDLFAILIVNHCFLLEDDSGWYLKSYFQASNTWFYHHIPFSYASGFVTEIIKLEAVIIWHLADVLIVVVTTYLTCRVKNFYGCLVRSVKSRSRRRVTWSRLQAQFTRLTALVCTVDDLISPFVFTSFLSHLFFICKQLYDIIQNKRNAYMFQRTECVFNYSYHPITTVFVSLSLATLLLRSSMVFLMTAHLHTLSREPLKALHFVPTSVYNYELQRLMDQVYHTKIGLSGLRFFYVTRGTVLSMISTILTYELVLIQFKADKN